MKKKLILVFTAIFLCILLPTYGQWQQHTIDPDIYFTTVVQVEDIEEDGDMDVVVGHYGSNMLLLFENNNMTWERDTIDDFFWGIVGVDIDDFDNDGNLDVVAAGYLADLVAWYRNDGGNPITWIKDTVANLDGANDVIAKDINGDGATDVVTNAFYAGDIFWYENNLPSGWTSHVIGTNLIYPEGLDVNDINDDGKPDVVAAATGSHKVVLYINNLPDTNWTEIIIDENLQWVFCAKIADINNDGDADIVVAGQDATGSEADIAWYENDGSELTWTKHTISADLTKSRWLAITDLDDDDYLDVIANDFLGDEIILFKNNDGGQNWTEIIIDDNINEPNTVFVADVDLDNELDILVTTRQATGLYWYENPIVGLNHAEFLEDTRIYPNPTYDLLNIETNTISKQGFEIEIFSTTGILMYQKEYKNGNEEFVKQIDLSSFQKGLYLVKINHANAVFVRKVIVN